MVRNVEDLEFHLPSHAQDMLDGLQRLRSQPKLADVTLLVGGQELPCHRGLLALSSPYFHAMFAGNFAESFSARVELRDVEPAMVAQLVDFVYTGRLTVTQGNVEALTRTAARLHFPAVQKVCGRYLQQQLDAANCLGICEFGEQQGLLGVAAKAWAFLRENFEAVAREDEFLELPRERLAACLAGDLLQVQPEQSRLEALLRWVRHDRPARAAHLPELLGLVHLDALPGPCLQRLLTTEPLLQDSEACRAALSQGPGVELPGLPQKLEEVLVVVGGRALEEGEDGGEEPTAHSANVAFYDTKAKTWMALPDFPDYHKWGFSLAALNNDIYVTGGSRGTKTDTWSTTQAWCFPLKEAAWRPVAPMRRARTNHASAALNGEIYAIGGTALDVVEVESYDPYTDSWTPVSPALKYVSNFSAAGCRGRLYLVGSSACKYNALALQCYSPATVPVVAALRRAARDPLPGGRQHQEGLHVRPRGQRVAEGAAPAQPARERRAGAAGGRALRHGRPLAGPGRRLPRGDGGLRPRARRVDAPGRAAPPLALPRRLRRLPGRVQVDPALRPRPGALTRAAGGQPGAGGLRSCSRNPPHEGPPRPAPAPCALFFLFVLLEPVLTPGAGAGRVVNGHGLGLWRRLPGRWTDGTSVQAGGRPPAPAVPSSQRRRPGAFWKLPWAALTLAGPA
ncbi:kelch-like protein 30 isoform X1 [Dasypus novemcinctus]|uniref:kelch-like protein 30 isoform X1 n=1 Tax=Dasypus novemcinctus TaxID=9361 RepID=UPI0026605149|nr:kelch-like protein 30 isoform X1 [Dasypus novemcinctus]